MQFLETSLVKISKKTRNAVSLAVFIARSGHQVPVTTQEMSVHLSLSISYVERILKELKSHDLVKSYLGPGGGYQICGQAAAISVWEIVKVFESPLIDEAELVQEGGGMALSYVRTMQRIVAEFLSSQNLAQLAERVAQEVPKKERRGGRFGLPRSSRLQALSAPNSVFQWHAYSPSKAT
jgi:Rrf2 family transcriptional regulator, iron-sulfur cluster assembly transcription factor